MQFSVESLEYDALLALVGRYVRSEGGRDRLERLRPTVDRSALAARHALIQEAMDYLRVHRVTFADIPALPELFARLGLGGITLDIAAIEAVQEFLGEVGGLGSRWREDARQFPRLAEMARGFPDLRSLRTDLGRAVRAGEINEDYSPELKRLRREVERARARLNRKLESILKSPEFAGQLQEQLVTLRNGRYVIPIRTEQKRSVSGIVHGMSSSGATVFMEPLETLDMNNDLVRLQEEEQREVQRVLGELTGRVQERAEDLSRAAALRTEMEVLFGIAQYGRAFDCVPPRFSGDGFLRLRRARHPLLDDRMRSAAGSAVPLDLEMEPEERVLVISGPNAGGKTVVLKTLGLFALMAQSGIPVPADEALLPIMDQVVADIGDQQSIANQLSTFSAHVLAVSRMIESASPDSLILLDEIGSSTEPAEGAALAIAVLEHFRKVGSRTVATTHYNRLKMYAETTSGVRNAAMEFNEATLEPTYRLIHGLAGQSSGLKIAERLRLPAELVAAARQALDRSELDAARYVDELKERVASLEQEKRSLETERRQFQAWKEAMSRRIDEERQEELDRIEKRLDSVVQEIRDRAAAELRSAGREAVKRFDRSIDRARAHAGREIRREQSTPAPALEPVRPEKTSERPREGSRVRIRSLGVDGAVSRVFSDEVEVAIGSMKMRRPFDDLEVMSPPGAQLTPRVHLERAERPLDSNEINLIGCSSDEAVDRLDKFLDDAYLAGLSLVRIVHGTGMGVLRRSVSKFLESHPLVDRFEPAGQNQGGAGATVAYLKE